MSQQLCALTLMALILGYGTFAAPQLVMRPVNQVCQKRIKFGYRHPYMHHLTPRPSCSGAELLGHGEVVDDVLFRIEP